MEDAELKKQAEKTRKREVLQFANMVLAALFTELLIRLSWFTGTAGRFYCP